MKLFGYPLARICLRRRILRHFDRYGQDYPEEYGAAADFLRHNRLSFMPASLMTKYMAQKKSVEVLEENGLPYVLHREKKLFFRKSLAKTTIRKLYVSLLMEMDPSSPHRYTDPDFTVETGSVILDMGAAEGIFTLEHIEKIKHAYLFECDEEWMAPLAATFAPWKEKVTVVRKFVSDCSDGDFVTLDEFIGRNGIPVNFIKMDIEGAETAALRGAKGILTDPANRIKIAACCYHRPMDYESISSFFLSLGYHCRVNDGFLCYKYQPYPPYFRKGVIKAQPEPFVHGQ